MATQTTGGGSTTSFTTTPQAQDDTWTYSETNLAAQSFLLIDVMSNDLGGKAKVLWSIDDGDNDAQSALLPEYSESDLFNQDPLTAFKSAWELTEQGNWIRINCGKVEYRLNDGTSNPPPENPAGSPSFNTLSAGLFTDTFIYAIRLANGTLSTAKVTINITGENDAPTVTALVGSVGEDGPSFSQDLLSGAADVDTGTTLSIVGAEASLTTTGGRTLTLGVDYTVTGSTFALTAAGFAKFNNLPQGSTDSFVFDFGVSDGIATTANTLSVTINGSNDGDDFDEIANQPTAVIMTAGLNGNQSPLAGSQFNDTLMGGQAGDTIYGGAGDDTIYGFDPTTSNNQADGDTIYGGSGNDIIFGNQDGDVIYGGSGNDIIRGNGGSDTLYGGQGADEFVYDRTSDPVDLIMDFEHGVDKIVFDNAAYSALADGPLSASAFATGTAATTAAHRIIYNDLTGELFYDADGSGAGTQVLIADFNNLPILTASDFLVI